MKKTDDIDKWVLGIWVAMLTAGLGFWVLAAWTIIKIVSTVT